MQGLKLRADKATGYNLEVEGDHTYFVGDNGAWVHNSGPGCLIISRDSKSVGALKNGYFPKKSIYVFDFEREIFAVKNADIGHPELGELIGSPRSDIAGGTLQRGPNGEFFTTENSGRTGEDWNDLTRSKFTSFMKDMGLTHIHLPWD